MARKTYKGTPLKVFSGKEATLNLISLLLLNSTKAPMTKYEIYKQIHSMRGYRNIESKTIYRRIDALNLEGWIIQAGSRPAAVQGESKLFQITLKGKAALRLAEKGIEAFLQTATDKQLAKLIDAFDD